MPKFIVLRIALVPSCRFVYLNFSCMKRMRFMQIAASRISSAQPTTAAAATVATIMEAEAAAEVEAAAVAEPVYPI